jgi:hypothetical protein
MEEEVTYICRHLHLDLCTSWDTFVHPLRCPRLDDASVRALSAIKGEPITAFDTNSSYVRKKNMHKHVKYYCTATKHGTARC